MLGTNYFRHAMLCAVAAAVLAARLGDPDFAKLTSLGLERDETVAIHERAFDEVSGSIDLALAADLRAALPHDAPATDALVALVALLTNQND